jgi:hypothetical protein
MINDRFSAAAFERAGYGSDMARHLAKELQTAIQEELDNVIEPAMLGIIAKLNSLGHNLSAVGELRPGDKQFREPLNDDKQHYKFLVALDVVISVGYPQTVDVPPFAEG